MDGKKPKLRWTPEIESYILNRHRVRREPLDALMEADDLSIVGSRFGRLMFQGTVDFFIASVFNYPTLSEAYKYAAYDGLGRVAKRAP